MTTMWEDRMIAKLPEDLPYDGRFVIETLQAIRRKDRPGKRDALWLAQVVEGLLYYLARTGRDNKVVSSPVEKDAQS